MFEHVIDHAARAVGRLTTQFKSSAQFKALMTALGVEVQAIEDAIFDLPSVRDIDNATGVTLDKIAALVKAPTRALTNSGTDDQLREMIRLQIIVNKATGTDADLYAIASHITTIGPDTVWKVRHGAPGTWAKGNVGDPSGEFTHYSFVEVVALGDDDSSISIDNIITGNDARYFASLFKAVAPAGTRVQFRYRSQDALTAFRFSGGATGLAAGMLSYWKLDGDSSDAVGTNPGTNHAISYVAGLINQGIVNSGAGSYIDLGTANLNLPGDMSFMCWVSQVDSDFHFLFCRLVGGGGVSSCYEFRISSNQVQACGVGSAVIGSAAGAILVSSATWQQIVITRTAAGAVVIYVDGVVSGSGGTLPAPTSLPAQATLIGSRDDHFKDLTHKMDECAVWNRVLTAGEVTSLRNGGAGKPVGTFTMSDRAGFGFGSMFNSLDK